jgi:hypothetical protein
LEPRCLIAQARDNNGHSTVVWGDGLDNVEGNRGDRIIHVRVVELHGTARLEWGGEKRDRRHDEPSSAQLHHNAAHDIHIDR